MQWWSCCRPVLKLRLCLGWGDSFPYFVLYLPSYFINFYILGNFITQNLTRYQNIIDVLILNKYVFFNCCCDNKLLHSHDKSFFTLCRKNKQRKLIASVYIASSYDIFRISTWYIFLQFYSSYLLFWKFVNVLMFHKKANPTNWNFKE